LIMRTLKSIALTFVLVLSSAAVISAQVRGDARLAGKIIDDQGQPLADVVIRATKKGETQPLQAKSNAKGEWALAQLAAGEWTLEFSKDGYEPQSGNVTLEETSNMDRVSVTLAKAKADPNVEIQGELKRADGMLRVNQFAEARKVYEDLLAKYPNVFQLHRFIAAAYAGEKNYPKAIEHLKLVLEKEPANVDVKVLMAELMMEQGAKTDAVAVLQTIDLTQIKDPLPFINGAITLINEGKADDAVAMLTKLGEQFPKQNEINYYRGRAYLAAKKLPEAKADIEKFVAAAPPDARELADAKKILEQLKDVK
jgi:tetratricopeptide (TPR) repeat protein